MSNQLGREMVIVGAVQLALLAIATVALDSGWWLVPLCGSAGWLIGSGWVSWRARDKADVLAADLADWNPMPPKRSFAVATRYVYRGRGQPMAYDWEMDDGSNVPHMH